MLQPLEAVVLSRSRRGWIRCWRRRRGWGWGRGRGWGCRLGWPGSSSCLLLSSSLLFLSLSLFLQLFLSPFAPLGNTEHGNRGSLQLRYFKLLTMRRAWWFPWPLRKKYKYKLVWSKPFNSFCRGFETFLFCWSQKLDPTGLTNWSKIILIYIVLKNGFFSREISS